MGNIFDAKEIIDNTEALGKKMKSVEDKLSDLHGCRNFLSNNMQFTGEFADSVKSYNLEVHDKASETIYLMLNALQEAAKKFEDASTALDSNKNAHIEADYLTTTQKYKIMNYRSAFEICNRDIQKEVDAISDIVGLSLPTSTTVEKCDSTLTFLSDLNTKVEQLSDINAVSDLRNLLDSFNSMIGYMKNTQSASGTTTYTPGDIANQSWYNDLETNTQTVKDNSVAMEEVVEAIINMPKDMTDESFEAWAKAMTDTYGDLFISALEGAGSLGLARAQYNAAIKFLGYNKIYRDTAGRMKWGNRFLEASDGLTKGYGNGLKMASNIDASDFLKGLKGASKTGMKAFKQAINPGNDVLGWSKATKLANVGKGLGIASTLYSLNENRKTNFSDGFSVKNVVNFVTDSTVDVGLSAGAVGVGAAVGSLLLPPLGTVVGAGVGAVLNVTMNVPLPIVTPPKTIVNLVKDGVKSITSKAFGFC